ncbi:MAG: GAP family protein [Actinobacteria bacterium]|nr:GAP family protein [Actinomycetota bacterium]
MSNLLGIVLPLAVGAAISPSITVIVLALLASKDHPRQRATAFLIGVAGIMLVWAVIIWSAMWSLIQRLERDVTQYSTDLVDDYSAAIDVGLGALLLCFGFWRLLSKPKPSTGKGRFNISQLASGSYSRQVIFGAIMQGRNVTSLLLFFSAQQHIVSAPLPLWERVFTTVLVIAILSGSTWLPMLIPTSGTSKLRIWLAPVGEWIGAHSRAIEAGAALVFGAYLIIRWLLFLF